MCCTFRLTFTKPTVKHLGFEMGEIFLFSNEAMLVTFERFTRRLLAADACGTAMSSYIAWMMLWTGSFCKCAAGKVVLVSCASSNCGASPGHVIPRGHFVARLAPLLKRDETGHAKPSTSTAFFLCTPGDRGGTPSCPRREPRGFNVICS